ncbi:MAG: hypothetical protein WC728_11215 [Elusimicrobiota bacterium]
MPVFDIFGLKSSETSPGPDPEDAPLDSADPPAAGGSGRGLWGALLAADALLIAVCLGVLGWRILEARDSSQTPAARVETRSPRPKKEPAAQAPPAQPAPQPSKPEAKKPEPAPAKPEAKKPEVKKPEEKPAAKAEAKKPEPKKTAAASKHAVVEPPAAPGKAVPVRFEYPDSSAKQVTLLGPFLNKSGGRALMFKTGKGEWVRKVFLNPSQTYRFRFEVDKGGKARITPWETLEVR